MSTVWRLTSPRRLEQEPLQLPDEGPRDDEAIVETQWSAISPGTELAAFVGAPPLRPTAVPYPRLVGYLNAGRVVRAGLGFGARAGDRVLTAAPHGSHALVPRRRLFGSIPDGVVSRDATVAYLFHLGLNALRRGGCQPGWHVGVIGLGAIGLATVRMAVLLGASVHAVSGHDRPREIARRLGAATVHEKHDPADTQVRSAAGGGVDLVVSTSNAWADWELALSLPRRNGTIAVLGFPGRGLPPATANPLDSQYFYDQQLSIVCAGNTSDRPGVPVGDHSDEIRRNVGWVLALMEQGRIDVSDFLSREFPADRLPDAYEALLRRERSPVTYVLRWSNGD